MSSADIVAIVNPLSGAGAASGVAERRVALLERRFASAGVAGAVHLTERRHHARPDELQLQLQPPVALMDLAHVRLGVDAPHLAGLAVGEQGVVDGDLHLAVDGDLVGVGLEGIGGGGDGGLDDGHARKNPLSG